jgi:hypothetical protein
VYTYVLNSDFDFHTEAKFTMPVDRETIKRVANIS